MATYIVGDIQGCFVELTALLNTVNFNPKLDHLYVAGDLVARGEESLATLRFLHSLGGQAHIVLGNHDIHLLAVANAIKPVKARDKIASILDAPDRETLLYWLRQQPLLIHTEQPGKHNPHGFVMTHAGIPPCWDLQTAKVQAKKVQTYLKSDDYLSLLRLMYSDEPHHWTDTLTNIEQLRFTINALTRMRFCHPNGHLDFQCKLPPDQVDSDDLLPWFDVANRKSIEPSIIFGHWAALNGKRTKEVIGLDTGCVWGGKLSLLRWEDGVIFSQAAKQGSINAM